MGNFCFASPVFSVQLVVRWKLQLFVPFTGALSSLVSFPSHVIRPTSYTVSSKFTFWFIYYHDNQRCKTPGAPGFLRLVFVLWRVVYVGPQCVTYFMSPFWRLEFWVGYWEFRKFVHP